MQAFIDSFDTKKNEIVEKSTQYQTQIVDSLEKLSVRIFFFLKFLFFEG